MTATVEPFMTAMALGTRAQVASLFRRLAGRYAPRPAPLAFTQLAFRQDLRQMRIKQFSDHSTHRTALSNRHGRNGLLSKHTCSHMRMLWLFFLSFF
jgi:hypothetical protein